MRKKTVMGFDRYAPVGKILFLEFLISGQPWFASEDCDNERTYG